MKKSVSISGKRTKGFRILAVDDDILVLEYLKSIFKSPKYIIETAENGEEGIIKAKKFNPDIILSDVVMPKINGYEFCKAIRSDSKFTNTIFLLLSAESIEVKDTVKGLRGGADDFLLKPLKKKSVIAKIDAFLRIKMLQDDLVCSNEVLAKTIDELKEHKARLERSIEADKKKTKLLENSLEDISFLMEELENSHQHDIALNRDLKKNFDDMISLLASIVELRNPHHKGHSQKVAEISVFIAHKIGLPENETRDIEIAALLHEIGMLGIPDDILNKVPTIPENEVERVLSQYPLVGESLLKGYSGLERVAKIIRHLNENIDGSGYPDRIGGGEIPIGSQIIKATSHFEQQSSDLFKPNEIYRVFNSLKEEVDSKYDGNVIRYLKEYIDTFADRRKGRRSKHINILDLKEGMILSDDVYTSTGIKLVPKGTKLSESSINCILNYNKTDPLDKDIKIQTV